MSHPVFVDTGAWFAVTVPWDANHTAAVTWLSGNSRLLLTTDYVIDETLTLLKARGEITRALKIGEQFFAGNLAIVHQLTENDVRSAWEVFRQFSDKEWSFTDCTSKIVIERLGIDVVFAFDHHFRQFGTVTVFP